MLTCEPGDQTPGEQLRAWETMTENQVSLAGGRGRGE